jgi:16S rRNA (adenine1518-N6/adenine1519-N6)-dimethyltransferase
MSSIAEVYHQDQSILARTRFLLEHFDLKARKGLGQHFLINQGILDKIIQAAALSPDDLVIEIGPGVGVLTHELLHKAGWVVALEIDRKLAPLLQAALGQHGNLTVLAEDVLEEEPGALIEREKASFGNAVREAHDYKVVANLPYYITQPIIRHFCEAKLKPLTMTIMVQKEVGKNIVAGPGNMSILAASVQFYGKPQIVAYVPAANFFPAPKVDSAILQITLYPTPPYQVSSAASFFAVVRAGFCAARKQIVNSLGQGFDIPRSDVLNWLMKAGISPTRRAESLGLEEWASLERNRPGERPQ